MGSSMRTAVFTENVVEGLKRWRARANARKNLKISYSARPSLDASVDPSLPFDTSPSFSLSASYSIDPNPPLDTDHVTIEVNDEAKHTDEQPREHKRNGSFEGFNVSNAAPAMEKQSGL
jgi:mlo protein